MTNNSSEQVIKSLKQDVSNLNNNNNVSSTDLLDIFTKLISNIKKLSNNKVKLLCSIDVLKSQLISGSELSKSLAKRNSNHGIRFDSMSAVDATKKLANLDFSDPDEIQTYLSNRFKPVDFDDFELDDDDFHDLLSKISNQKALYIYKTNDGYSEFDIHAASSKQLANVIKNCIDDYTDFIKQQKLDNTPLPKIVKSALSNVYGESDFDVAVHSILNEYLKKTGRYNLTIKKLLSNQGNSIGILDPELNGDSDYSITFNNDEINHANKVLNHIENLYLNYITKDSHSSDKAIKNELVNAIVSQLSQIVFINIKNADIIEGLMPLCIKTAYTMGKIDVFTALTIAIRQIKLSSALMTMEEQASNDWSSDSDSDSDSDYL